MKIDNYKSASGTAKANILVVGDANQAFIDFGHLSQDSKLRWNVMLTLCYTGAQQAVENRISF